MGYDKITVRHGNRTNGLGTMDNLAHFVECFEGVDRLVILPVWAVNEEPRSLILPRYSVDIIRFGEQGQKGENG